MAAWAAAGGMGQATTAMTDLYTRRWQASRHSSQVRASKPGVKVHLMFNENVVGHTVAASVSVKAIADTTRECMTAQALSICMPIISTALPWQHPSLLLQPLCRQLQRQTMSFLRMHPAALYPLPALSCRQGMLLFNLLVAAACILVEEERAQGGKEESWGRFLPCLAAGGMPTFVLLTTTVCFARGALSCAADRERAEGVPCAAQQPRSVLEP